MTLTAAANRSKLHAFIGSYFAEHRVGPTFREMGDHLGTTSMGGVHELIADLLHRGLVRRVGYGNSRGGGNKAKGRIIVPTGNVAVSVLLSTELEARLRECAPD